jgi:hypothetical protein
MILRNPALVVAACTALLACQVLALRQGEISLSPWGGQAEDSWNLEEIQQRGARLEEEMEVIRQQGEIYRGVIRGVVAGNVHLAEAAAALRNRLEVQGIADSMRLQYHGDTDEERYCRAVIDRVRIELAGDSRQADVLRRLENEMDSHLARATGHACPLIR